MKGWHKESYRHYLASKGIKTSRYMRNKYRAPVFLSRDIDEGATAYVKPQNPDDIYISRMREDDPEKVAKTISHEELHNVLQKEVGSVASTKLDNIQWGSADEFDFTMGERKKNLKRIRSAYYGENKVASQFDKFHEESGKFLEEEIPRENDEFMEEYKEIFDDHQDLVEKNDNDYREHGNSIEVLFEKFETRMPIEKQRKLVDQAEEMEGDFLPLADQNIRDMKLINRRLKELKSKYPAPKKGDIILTEREFPGGHGVRVERK